MPSNNNIPLSELLSPTSTITTRVERELFGTTMSELGLHPEDIDIRRIQLGLIRHAFKIIGDRIDDGLRDQNRMAIHFLIDTVGTQVAGILQQALQAKQERISELEGKTKRVKIFWHVPLVGPEDVMEVEILKGAIEEIYKLTDDLRKKLSGSFLEDQDLLPQPIQQATAVFGALTSLKNVIKVIIQSVKTTKDESDADIFQNLQGYQADLQLETQAFKAKITAYNFLGDPRIQQLITAGSSSWAPQTENDVQNSLHFFFALVQQMQSLMSHVKADLHMRIATYANQQMAAFRQNLHQP